MKYVILADGTRIEGCTYSTNPENITVQRDSFGEAGAVRDLFTDSNSSVIKVYDDETEAAPIVGTNLVLLPGAELVSDGGYFFCMIKLRVKTKDELINEQIAELQEAIIEGGI